MAEGEHGGAEREHKGATREQGRATREHGGAEGEHIDETVVSGGAKRRHLSQPAVTCWPGFGDTIYTYNLYPYNASQCTFAKDDIQLLIAIPMFPIHDAIPTGTVTLALLNP